MLRFLPLVVILSVPSLCLADDVGGLYGEVLKSQRHLTTIRSLGMAILALPYERETVMKNMLEAIWVNQVDVVVGAAHKEVALSLFAKQVEKVETAMKRNGMTELQFFGFTRHGSIDSVEFFFSADTPNGPLLIRIPVSFAKDKARLFGIDVFEGWEETRPVLRDIEIKAMKTLLTITYDPPKKRDGL